jgi:hypothetical protein
MISNEKMRAEKCGELKLKTDILATFGQPHHQEIMSAAALDRNLRMQGSLAAGKGHRHKPSLRHTHSLP